MASTTNKKRIIKPSQTLRQQVEKSNQAKVTEDKKSPRLLKKLFLVVFKPLRILGRLSKYQPFKLLIKISIFLGKIIFPAYFRNSWKELKQVTWPSWKESRRLTYAVIIFSVVFGAIIATVDYGLSNLFRHILIRK